MPGGYLGCLPCNRKLQHFLDVATCPVGLPAARAICLAPMLPVFPCPKMYVYNRSLQCGSGFSVSGRQRGGHNKVRVTHHLPCAPPLCGFQASCPDSRQANGHTSQVAISSCCPRHPAALALAEPASQRPSLPRAHAQGALQLQAGLRPAALPASRHSVGAPSCTPAGDG